MVGRQMNFKNDVPILLPTIFFLLPPDFIFL